MSVKRLNIMLERCWSALHQPSAAVAKPFKSWLAVMGNESADLDSMVCSLLYACHLTHQRKDDTETLVFPLFNIDRRDFDLRLDAKHVFEDAGVDISLIPHLDDLPSNLHSMQSQGILQLCLVDHNRLADSQLDLAKSVVEIVDHHKDEHLYDEFVVKQCIKTVGSCATLVVDKMLNSNAEDSKEMETFVHDSDISRMALSVILLDTANLDASKKKFDPLDTAIAEILASHCNLEDAVLRQQLHDMLLRYRTDVSLLTSDQIMRKDLKFGREGEIRFAISSAPLSLAQWLRQDPELISSLRAFVSKSDVALFAVMTAFNKDSGEFSRELLICSSSSYVQIFKAFIDELAKSQIASNSGLHLDQKSIPELQDEFVVVFDQKNVLASRKQVMPAVAEICSKL
eukprot:TRINITY_DN40425_c0_g1_i1.p1 TRINITY_DN40425_c0_g1~~TRINITY_DN40425_c0_g1_i1.p1  ORF type:complete len:400 (-),score=110.11 TRINITY_DN40425_c0_g1_i1:560-1759(-)